MTIPDDFVVPGGHKGPGFRLEPLGPEHNVADHAAWTSSVEHIRSTPGFPFGDWPPLKGLSLQENLRDLKQHAEDFTQRKGFTYTVLDDTDKVIGCVYVYPSNTGTTHVRSWVTADRKDLDQVLHDTVADWLATRWPFTHVHYRD
ncbi:MAG: hypothetical protein J2O48_09180 [Solirubrobacterales bacterium]|nr:hypothetical protein [Solirubrobacterales bacterium]